MHFRDTHANTVFTVLDSLSTGPGVWPPHTHTLHLHMYTHASWLGVRHPYGRAHTHRQAPLCDTPMSHVCTCCLHLYATVHTPAQPTPRTHPRGFNCPIKLQPYCHVQALEMVCEATAKSHDHVNDSRTSTAAVLAGHLCESRHGVLQRQRCFQPNSECLA